MEEERREMEDWREDTQRGRGWVIGGFGGVMEMEWRWMTVVVRCWVNVVDVACPIPRQKL